MSDMELIFQRAEQLLDKFAKLLDRSDQQPVFDTDQGSCWRYSATANRLEMVKHVSHIRLVDLRCIDRQKDLLVTNTRQFLYGLPSNNALLWGPRGTGKSSLIKALLNEYKHDGLKLIEVQAQDLNKLTRICDLLYETPGRFIIFCDDLSFEANDPSYKAIKVVLDGSASQAPDNVLVYATSNRRHLLPEDMSENLQSGIIDGELHLHEGIEEKLALSERFGLWVAFHPFNQQQYLQIVEYWLARQPDNQAYDKKAVTTAALRWALQHGSRSGRSAQLFSRDWAGKAGLGQL